MDALMRRRMMMLADSGWGELVRSEIVTESISGRLLSSYDTTNYNYESASNMANAYTSSTSSYAQIYLKKGDVAETFVFFKWDMSDIPVGATINSVYCVVRVIISATNSSNVSARTALLYSGSTSKGSALTIGSSAQDRSMTVGTWTRDELQNAMIRIYAKRASGNPSTSHYFRMYYAKLSVDYSYEQYFYTAKVKSGGSVLASREYESGKTAILTIQGPLPSGFAITDNDVDVTAQLAQDGNNYTYTIQDIADGHRILMSDALTCTLTEAS